MYPKLWFPTSDVKDSGLSECMSSPVGWQQGVSPSLVAHAAKRWVSRNCLEGQKFAEMSLEDKGCGQLPLSLLQWAHQGCPSTALSPHHHHLFLHGKPLWDLELDNQVLRGCSSCPCLFLRATAVTSRQIPSQFHGPCLSLLPALCWSRGTELHREGGR